nr:hypothetical protein [Tanacetum cinerariifolium]
PSANLCTRIVLSILKLSGIILCSFVILILLRSSKTKFRIVFVVTQNPVLRNIKWYQSLVRRFDLQKNNFQSTSLSLPIHNQKWINKPTLAKIPILDTRKFEQWQFRIQQYLQHEHYALWEVIEFGDSYEVPASAASTATIDTASDGTGKKKGMTVTVTTEDMQKRKNDVKARTTLLLSLPDEQQLRIKIEQDDLNQKFLTSLAPEWLMHTIVWRNRSDLDTISLDDLYNHIKVYKSEVQKKSEPNSQNIAFISSAKHSRGNKEVNTASVSTTSTNVPTASANIGVASISQDTAYAYIASQSSGSQIKFEDINQIDEDDMEEMDIK